MQGLLVVNKPYGWTSMNVIRTVRRLSGEQKVGHAGTLDPLATGVLLVCLGSATKQIEQLMATEKRYRTTFDLSAFSTTDDLEGIIEPLSEIQPPSLATIEEALATFVGTIMQTPPRYSAIKMNGVPAYKRAVAGKEFTLNPRPITIHSITLISYTWPNLTIEVHCGKGTYIRSLARELGQSLNTGGYATAIERTAVGPYLIANAIDPKAITTLTQEHLLSVL
jgi:tRNA pseudouridine55 synthase